MKKVLEICGSLGIGGAERVAANICMYASNEFEFHYLIFDGLGTDYVPEIESKGGKVFSLPSPSYGHKEYMRSLGALIEQYKYDVVHSHTQFNSGLNLLVAHKHNVLVRIAHSHTTKTEHQVPAKQKLYEQAMRILIKKHATHYVACGKEAGEWMYGKKYFEEKGIIINNGIDTEAFMYSDTNREKIRRQYHISDSDFVIGHSGMLSKLKNQRFLILLLSEILKRKPDTKLLLFGRDPGEMTDQLSRYADELKVKNSVIFAGPVLNINECVSAMDVFAFPSLREGTPLALLEAQANGLPCVISDTIPNDVVLTDLVHPLPLENTESWIASLVSAKRNDSEEYSNLLKEMGFDMRKSYQLLYDIYCK